MYIFLALAEKNSLFTISMPYDINPKKKYIYFRSKTLIYSSDFNKNWIVNSEKYMQFVLYIRFIIHLD